MEHRWSKRNKVEFPVLIFENNLPVALGSAKDVSSGGLFLHTGPGWMLPAKMDIGLYNDGDQIRLPCKVVHRTANGFGLMFNEIRPQTRAFIHQLMQNVVGMQSYSQAG